MANDVHGHRVLEHLLAQPTPLTVEALRTWAIANHGADASYHTCAKSGMSLEGLLGFLTEHGKVSLTEDRLQVNAGKVCQHDDHPAG